jgi:hypothetical protein
MVMAGNFTIGDILSGRNFIGSGYRCVTGIIQEGMIFKL